LAVLKCVKIREFYEFFKIRKMRILELCATLHTQKNVNVRSSHRQLTLIQRLLLLLFNDNTSITSNRFDIVHVNGIHVLYSTKPNSIRKKVFLLAYDMHRSNLHLMTKLVTK